MRERANGYLGGGKVRAPRVEDGKLQAEKLSRVEKSEDEEGNGIARPAPVRASKGSEAGPRM